MKQKTKTVSSRRVHELSQDTARYKRVVEDRTLRLGVYDQDTGTFYFAQKNS